MERTWSWLSENLQEHVGTIVLGLLALAWARHAWSQTRAQEHEEAGLCARCGRGPATVALRDFASRLQLCEECAVSTRRSHGAAYYMFLVMAVILVAHLCLFTYVELTDPSARHSGFLLQFALIVFGAVVLVLRMRKVRRER